MKSFSDAIRDGAKRGQQIFGLYFNGGGYDSCAAGAAIFGISTTGIGIAMTQGVSATLKGTFRGLSKQRAVCPIDSCGSIARSTEVDGKFEVLDIVYHLNDLHFWTREAIADWYEENFEASAYDRGEAKQLLNELVSGFGPTTQVSCSGVARSDTPQFANRQDGPEVLQEVGAEAK